MGLDNLKETRKDHITVGFLFEANRQRLMLEELNGEVGFDRRIEDGNIHRPGLALAGYVELFTYNRVQIFGNTEIRYLQHLTLAERISSFANLMKFDIPCMIITDNNVFDQELIALATEHKIPIFRTPYATTKLSYLLVDILDDQFAPQILIHGSLVDVYGIGLLLMGRSGIGKSEIALDLIERGHRLVADDVVMVTRKGERILLGTGTELVKHFMEIRGLGLIDVRSVFGVRAIRQQKRVEVIIELLDWERNAEYTRTGLDQEKISIMGVDLTRVKLPIFPGKNVTVIAEVIALDYLLKHFGYDAAKEFSKKLESALAEKTRKTRSIDYFEHDFE